MKKPNFFIIGAPKCGTTSMASWLAKHPQIFMSSIKEPHYFDSDQGHLSGHFSVGDLSRYEALFSQTTEKQVMIGEASVWYLYSHVAALKILEYAPAAKFVVMVRNPIEMVCSLHDQMVFSEYENIRDFKKAWLLQEKRALGRNVPKRCAEPRFIQYGAACCLGNQLQRLFAVVPRNQVHVVVFDDLLKDPRNEYQRILKFLNIEDDGRTDFVPENPAKEKISYFLPRIITTLVKLKKKMGVKKAFGVSDYFHRKNLRVRSRVPLDNEMRSALSQYFREDVSLLEKLLGRNFKHWLA